MENQPEETTSAELFGEYANLLWRWSWLLVLLACLAGGVAYYTSSQQTPVYQSSTLVMINAAPSAASATYGSVVTSQQLVETYAQILITHPVLDGVKQQLGLTELDSKSIQVDPLQNTQLLTVTVQDTDPQRAAAIANSLVSVFASQVQADQSARYTDSQNNLEVQMAAMQQQIQTTTTSLNMLAETPENLVTRSSLQVNLTQLQNSYSYLLQSYSQLRLAIAQSTSTVVQKDPAVPDLVPVKPQPVRSAILAAVVGLLLAGGVIFLIEFLDDTIRDPQEITRKWGVPVLGIITRFKPNGGPLITVNQPRAPVSEAFRSLRTSLEFAAVDSPLRSILITSPSPQDGKTTVAANLACVIAQAKHTVILLDADLRRPQIHKQFQLMNRLGLSNKLVQPKDQLSGSIQNTGLPTLKVITSGSLPPDPSELLGSAKMEEMMSSLVDQFDFLILDTPPVMMVTDAIVLASRVNGVILVVKPSVTRRTELHHVIDQLKQVNARLLGVVLNDVDVGRARYRYYRRYYTSSKYKYYKGYYHADASSSKEKPSAHTSLMKSGSPPPVGAKREAGSTSQDLMKGISPPPAGPVEKDSFPPSDSNSLL
jgi:succinoglycan biosynthesis transport protein ExoP